MATTAPMIEVRLRRVDQATGARMFDWPVMELDTVIPTLRAWGMNDFRAGDSIDPDDMSGHFVSDGSLFYFEILIDGE